MPLAGEGPRVDCVIPDLAVPDLDGLGVLARMREAASNVPVVVEAAHGGIDYVVCAMRARTIDLVAKPASAERLQVSLRNAFSAGALKGELKRSKAAEPVRRALATANAIRFAISHDRRQMSKVARKLPIGRSSLYRKLETLGLTDAGANSGQGSVAAG